MDTLAFVTAELQAKGTSLARLRRLLFGAPTEKTDEVLRKAGPARAGRTQGPAKDQAEDPARAPGHGRNGAAACTGARREKVEHARLKSGEACQGCLKGKLYPLRAPAVRVRVTGLAPLAATVWECERLRCNLCGEVSTAQAPAEVGQEKYDETAVAMTGLLKYGRGPQAGARLRGALRPGRAAHRRVHLGRHRSPDASTQARTSPTSSSAEPRS